MALANGRPVVRSHTRVVSRWLAIPTDRQVAGCHVCGVERLAYRHLDGLEDLDRIMLDPTRPGEDLAEFPLRLGNHRTGVIEDHEPGAGGPLVDGSYRSSAHPEKTIASFQSHLSLSTPWPGWSV